MSQRYIHLDLLKVTACLLMLWDHVAHFAGLGVISRLPGRFVLPMFALSLAFKLPLGSPARAMSRLLAWALPTQVLFYCIGITYLNILFTLLYGVFIATAGHRSRLVYLLLLLGVECFSVYAGQPVIEYGAAGVLFVAFCCFAFRNPLYWPVVLLLSFFINTHPLHQVVGFVSVILVLVFIRQDVLSVWVRRVPLWCWYAFYPAHMLTVWAIFR